MLTKSNETSRLR